jgi:hypothetical protein
MLKVMPLVYIHDGRLNPFGGLIAYVYDLEAMEMEVFTRAFINVDRKVSLAPCDSQSWSQPSFTEILKEKRDTNRGEGG